MWRSAWTTYAIGTALMLLAATGIAAAADKTIQPRGTRDGQPAVRLHREGTHNVSLYDTSGAADSPADATRSWIDKFRSTFGDRDTELRLQRQSRLGQGNATIFAYRQFMDGLPVEGSAARLLVSPQPPYFVSYGGFRLARRPHGGFPPDQINANDALNSVTSSSDYGQLPNWTQPTLVVYFDDDLKDAVRAWKFSGYDLSAPQPEAYTFFVSAADGSLVRARNEIYEEGTQDITGFVQALGSPGVYPATDGHPATTLDVPYARVSDASGVVTYSGDDGSYAASSEGLLPASITVDLESPWIKLQDETAPIISETATLDTVPAQRDFFFNPDAAESLTAQVDTFLHVNLTHDFWKAHQPEFTDIDFQMPANVNRPANCNAFFTPVGPSLNFLSAGSGCVNSAYSTVVSHEYGHFVVDRLGLFQGAFGEGFSDSVDLMMYDDPIIGRDFFGPGTSVRDIANAHQRYPCWGENHQCGQVLAGVWWDLNLKMQDLLGAQDGLDYTRQLFTDWAMITVGGSGHNSAHPQTAIEVLAVDDDDGNLANGSPHEEQICAAFALHNIACPSACTDIQRMRVTCRSDFSGSLNVRATITTDSGRGSFMTATLDGRQSRPVDVSRLGRATVAWNDVQPGSHEVCINGCSESCQTVTCGQ